MIIVRTPFRINLFGEGTDLPAYYERHGGMTLTLAIRRYCYLSVHRLSPFFRHRYRASYAETEMVVEPESFRHPVVRECLGYHQPRFGLEISHVSDLPGRTGLGTSSAFTVGLMHALHALHGERTTPEDLAREAVHVERERVGEPGGHENAYASAYGGFLELRYGPGPRIKVQDLTLSVDRLTALEQHLCLVSLGHEEGGEARLREQIRRVERNTASLARMKALAARAAALLGDGGDLAELGELLDESWRIKRSLADGVTTPDIDARYTAAREAGAVGGKLLGAGSGGYLLLWIPPEKRGAVREALAGCAMMDVVCSGEGSRVIFEDRDRGSEVGGQRTEI